MQLMTEQKLEHGRLHHLETHQQQHYHPIEPQPGHQQSQQQLQDQLDSPSAGVLRNTAGQQQHPSQHLSAAGTITNNINQNQLNQLISQQQQLTLNPTPTSVAPQANTTYQQHQPQAPAILQQHASRVHTHQQLTTVSPPMNNNTTTTANLAAQPPSSATMNNIQPSSYTKNHLINNNGAMHLTQADELSIKKRREDLSRRPSYRKIFNDITGMSGPLDLPPPPLVVGQLPPPVAQNRQSPQLMVGQPQQQQQQQQPPTSSPSPQALELLNSVGAASQMHDQATGATSQSPVSIKDLQRTTPTQLTQQQQQLQHSHHHQHPHLQPQNHLQQQQHQQHQQLQQQHHQHHHPLQQQASQHHQPQNQIQHQIQTATSPPLSGPGNEEASKKRELRLQKNREAAKECRRKKKEYIKCLENRVAVLENQNKALIDELKTLKDLYCKSTNE